MSLSDTTLDLLGVRRVSLPNSIKIPTSGFNKVHECDRRTDRWTDRPGCGNWFFYSAL